jgi:hypothetical protein
MTNFYVYELIDPRCGGVFYVGKGKGSRISAHEAEARKGKQSRKCDVIREIWSEGLVVSKRIVQRFDSDIDAYKFEAQHIASIGRQSLANMRDGGIGGRVRFGSEVLIEEAAQILRVIKLWASRGSVAVLNFGAFGKLDLAQVMTDYKARLAVIAAKVGSASVIAEASRIGVDLEFV